MVLSRLMIMGASLVLRVSWSLVPREPRLSSFFFRGGGGPLGRHLAEEGAGGETSLGGILPGRSAGSVPIEVAKARTGWPHFKTGDEAPSTKPSAGLKTNAAPTSKEGAPRNGETRGEEATRPRAAGESSLLARRATMPGQSLGSISLDAARSRTGWPHFKHEDDPPAVAASSSAAAARPPRPGSSPRRPGTTATTPTTKTTTTTPQTFEAFQRQSGDGDAMTELLALSVAAGRLAEAALGDDGRVNIDNELATILTSAARIASHHGRRLDDIAASSACPRADS